MSEKLLWFSWGAALLGSAAFLVPAVAKAQQLCPVNDAGCRYCFTECAVRPTHPEPRCQQGVIYSDRQGSAANCSEFWPEHPFGECLPVIDGTEPELPNGIDDNCDGIGLGDEFCDGIDNDGDGMVDEDAGSCLLRFAPVCFSGSDEEFTSMALSSLDFFNASLGLQQCSDNIGRRIILPSEVQSALGSVPCPACTDPAQPATATASLLEAAGLLDPAQYTGVHMIAGASPCGGGIRGAAAGKIIWGLGEWPVIFSHEIGHTAGFGEEYCSAAAGGNCWNSTLNPLEPQYGCDNCCTADYRLENETVSGWEVAANSNEPCGSPGNFIICCPGNRATNPSTGEFLDGDGRCIMSHTDAVGPRGWCPACLDHWQSLTNGSGTRISCDAVFPGAQPLPSRSSTYRLPSVRGEG